MIARKIIVIYCVALFCITGCRDREVTIELPYEGDRLVLWGKLEAGKPAKLLVRRTFPASGVIPEQTAVTTARVDLLDRKSTRLNSSHVKISYAVFCLKK